MAVLSNAAGTLDQNVSFEVFTVMSMKTTVITDAALCNLVDTD